jgi:hypothetical protein
MAYSVFCDVVDFSLYIYIYLIQFIKQQLLNTHYLIFHTFAILTTIFSSEFFCRFTVYLIKQIPFHCVVVS